MTDNTLDITPVPEDAPKRKINWKAIGTRAGIASAIVLVGFGVGRATASTNETVDPDPTPGE